MPSPRGSATRELLTLGPSIKPQLEKALAAQPDPEQDYRLKLILHSFLPKPPPPGAVPSTDFGGVRVMFARQLFQDAAGNVGVIAQGLRDGQSLQGPGVAVLESNKRAKAIFTKSLGFAGFNYQNESLPVAVGAGQSTGGPAILPARPCSFTMPTSRSSPMPPPCRFTAASRRFRPTAAFFWRKPAGPVPASELWSIRRARRRRGPS